MGMELELPGQVTRGEQSARLPRGSFPLMRFGVFEVDPVAGELRRDGRKVRVQDQPFQILCLLLERPGEVVSREEIQRRLWPSGVHVDFEQGLNKAVLKLRDALGDSAENPRFVETMARRGYRFVAPVHATAPVGEVEAAAERARPRPSLPWRRLILLAAAGAIAFLGGGLTWALLHRAASGPPPVRFTVPLPPGSALRVYDSSSIAFSHDGRRLVFAVRDAESDGLWVRSLDSLEAVRLPGTEGARSPFFSLDDEWIGFEAGEKLRRVAVTGGASQILCEMPYPTGATAEDRDGSIVLVPSYTGGLFRLPKPGSRPQRLTRPDPARSEGAHIWPRALPDGRGVLFTVWSGGLSFDQAAIGVLSPSGRWHVVLEGGSQACYAPPGYLVFVRGGALHAAPFDLERLAVTGPPVLVVQDVATDASTGAALYDVSPTGSLAYATGGAYIPRRRLVWVDRRGAPRPIGRAAQPYVSPRVSPDGRRLALWMEESQAEVWLYEPARDALTRATFSGDDHSPVWSPDGTLLAYESGRDSVHHIFLRRADGRGEERQVTSGQYHQYLSDWSPDGRWLAYTEFHPETGADVWVVNLDGAPVPRPIARSPSARRRRCSRRTRGGWPTCRTSPGSPRSTSRRFPAPGAGSRSRSRAERSRHGRASAASCSTGAAPGGSWP